MKFTSTLILLIGFSSFTFAQQNPCESHLRSALLSYRALVLQSLKNGALKTNHLKELNVDRLNPFTSANNTIELHLRKAFASIEAKMSVAERRQALDFLSELGQNQQEHNESVERAKQETEVVLNPKVIFKVAPNRQRFNLIPWPNEENKDLFLRFDFEKNELALYSSDNWSAPVRRLPALSERVLDPHHVVLRELRSATGERQLFALWYHKSTLSLRNLSTGHTLSLAVPALKSAIGSDLSLDLYQNSQGQIFFSYSNLFETVFAEVTGNALKVKTHLPRLLFQNHERNLAAPGVVFLDNGNPLLFGMTVNGKVIILDPLQNLVINEWPVLTEGVWGQSMNHAQLFDDRLHLAFYRNKAIHFFSQGEANPHVARFRSTPQMLGWVDLSKEIFFVTSDENWLHLGSPTRKDLPLVEIEGFCRNKNFHVTKNQEHQFWICVQDGLVQILKWDLDMGDQPMRSLRRQKFVFGLEDPIRSHLYHDKENSVFYVAAFNRSRLQIVSIEQDKLSTVYNSNRSVRKISDFYLRQRKDLSLDVTFEENGSGKGIEVIQLFNSSAK